MHIYDVALFGQICNIYCKKCIAKDYYIYNVDIANIRYYSEHGSRKDTYQSLLTMIFYSSNL